jgi:hypothetical protein
MKELAENSVYKSDPSRSGTFWSYWIRTQIQVFFSAWIRILLLGGVTRPQKVLWILLWISE